MKKTYIDTAMERIAPDLILKGGNVVDVFSGRVIKADVIIKDGIICGVGSYSGENEQDVSGKYIMPGFIDSHVHIESSMTQPSEYADVYKRQIQYPFLQMRPLFPMSFPT